MTVEYLAEQIKQNRQLIFDLDNTIYLETEFLFRVYNEISKTSVNTNPKIIYEFLKKTFSFGLFNCNRNPESLTKKILEIKKNYNRIQFQILKNKVFTLENFNKDLNKIFK